MTYGYSRQNFENRLAKGNKTEREVAALLESHGIYCEKPEMPEGLKTSEYTKRQIDLLANGKVLEIKGRSIDFTCVEDFRYDDVIVEGVNGFNTKERRPDFYVMASQKTGHIIALDVADTFDKWTVRSTTDRFRQITYPTFIAETRLHINLDELIRRLNGTIGSSVSGATETDKRTLVGLGV